MDPEKFIARGMAAVKAAIVAAPSHEEFTAGLEAMVRHIVSGPTSDDDPDPVADAANDTSTTSAA